jgi:hypothetical protein
MRRDHHIREEAKSDLFKYVMLSYNRLRRHSAIQYDALLTSEKRLPPV